MNGNCVGVQVALPSEFLHLLRRAVTSSRPGSGRTGLQFCMTRKPKFLLMPHRPAHQNCSSGSASLYLEL